MKNINELIFRSLPQVEKYRSFTCDRNPIKERGKGGKKKKKKTKAFDRAELKAQLTATN